MDIFYLLPPTPPPFTFSLPSPDLSSGGLALCPLASSWIWPMGDNNGKSEVRGQGTMRFRYLFLVVAYEPLLKDIVPVR